MFLTIKALGEHADKLSFLLSKHPDHLYERKEKEARVCLVYTISSPEETEVLLFVEPDPIDLYKGSSEHYDITHYINDREFAVSSLFCAYMRSALGTALNGKPKEAYAEWVQHPFQLELSFGPLASNLPDRTIEELFGALGYEVEIERADIAYPFQLKSRSSARIIRLAGKQTLQLALRQLFIMLPMLDDYKHYFIGEEEADKLHRYGEGWLAAHPLRELIIRRTLRFSPLITKFNRELAQKAERQPEDQQVALGIASPVDIEEEPPRKARLNELRYEAIAEVVEALPQNASIVDMGSGEGKLAARLGAITGVKSIMAVEPSGKSQIRALERFAKLEGRQGTVVPQAVIGSLFYYDEWLCGKDVLVLCEVIEHIDAFRLDQAIEMIASRYKPQSWIVTTPNKEYNKLYELDDYEMRHNDHRFEWTREQFREWCEKWGEPFGYAVRICGVGDADRQYGQPTQMAVFTRLEGEGRS
ncbi:3' terminal RNA ribose 2'-O-methyltransferase Hen1 [Paenibacillus algorifonticola]|uniref:Small RNA 2'-O-methyltransferase n=1 Tax=Paenibacillus algorifonticola TaxID=684063 RepID=A0A1I2CRK9_9BACL|nr:3' terminal RNA ribose 2'-O-methyltransferase Hen1 [Paenibacillus algorifonticola]SFE70951.1 3' terminal RNA ribose 2'-O-methyltransferase Hen1 [Paenibacillus algorifonticola]